MSRWNPSNPAVAGDEWYGAAQSTPALASLVGRGPSILATATQNVDTIATLVRRTTGITPISLLVDVYDLANPLVDTQSWAMALPAANRSNAAGWVKSSAGVESAYDVNAHNNVDDVIGSSTSLATGSSDQLRYQGVNPTTAPQVRFEAGNTFYDGDTGAPGATITGKRVSSVEVVAVIENASAHSVIVQGQLQIGATAYNADSGPETISYLNPALRRYRFAFYSNPATGLPWTNADAIALTDGTDAFGLAVTVKSGTGNLIVTALALQFRVLTERRVATGFGSSGGALDEWVSMALLDPADLSSAAWAKTSGHRYLLLYALTRGSTPGGLTVVDTSNVDGHLTDALTGADVRAWNLDHGAVPLSEIATTEGELPALLYVAGVASVDSLPYGDVDVKAASASSGVQKQRINTHSTQAYGTATILVGTTQPAGGGGQDAPLVVRLKKVSDNSVLAGPVSIDPDEVPADGRYHTIVVRFPAPAALTAGTAVYLEVQSTSTLSWFLPTLLTRTRNISSGDATASDAAAAGIGAAADLANADATADFPWSISLAPAAPTGLSRAALTFANRPALALAEVPPTIGYVALDWTSTVLGGAFLRYEVQRLELDGTWADIGRVTLEASSYWNDPEPPRNVPVSYRVRVVRTDGGFSAWATFADITVPADLLDIIVVSAHASDIGVAFLDMSDTHEWEQREAAKLKIVDIYGRDFPVAFGSTTKAGEAFTRVLLVADADPNIADGTIADHGVFEPALAMLQDRSLPHLVYCDGFGQRWLVVATAAPVADAPVGMYLLTATFTQVAGAVLPVETDTPWVP